MQPISDDLKVIAKYEQALRIQAFFDILHFAI